MPTIVPNLTLSAAALTPEQELVRSVETPTIKEVERNLSVRTPSSDEKKTPCCDPPPKDELHERVYQANVIALNALIITLELKNENGKVTRVQTGGELRRTLFDCRTDVWRRMERFLTPEAQRLALKMLRTVLNFKSSSATPTELIRVLAKHNLVSSKSLTTNDAQRDLFWSVARLGRSAVALPAEDVTCAEPNGDALTPSLALSLPNRSVLMFGSTRQQPQLVKRWSCCGSTDLFPNHHRFPSEAHKAALERTVLAAEKRLQDTIAQAFDFAEAKICPACGETCTTTLSMERHFIGTHCETACDWDELDKYYFVHYVVAALWAEAEEVTTIFPHPKAQLTLQAQKDRYRVDDDDESSSLSDD